MSLNKQHRDHLNASISQNFLEQTTSIIWSGNTSTASWYKKSEAKLGKQLETIYNVLYTILGIDNIFSMPHLLWQGTSIYNCHRRWTVTITSVAKRLAVELPLPVFRLNRSAAAWIRTLNSKWEAKALTDCATAAAYLNVTNTFLIYLWAEDNKKFKLI